MFGWSRRRRDKNVTCGGIVGGGDRAGGDGAGRARGGAGAALDAGVVNELTKITGGTRSLPQSAAGFSVYG
jgi:hypothetical protein